MEEFAPSSDAWNWEWKCSSQVLGLESGMEEFEPKFRRLESGMEEFEPSSKLAIGNGGVRAKFDAWNPKWRSSIQNITLGIGNGGVRANVRSLESEIETLELSSEAWNWE